MALVSVWSLIDANFISSVKELLYIQFEYTVYGYDLNLLFQVCLRLPNYIYL